jgi:hypothetical protein
VRDVAEPAAAAIGALVELTSEGRPRPDGRRELSSRLVHI